MPVDIITYPSPVETPDPRQRTLEINKSPNAFHRNAVAQGRYFGDVGRDLRIYFPECSYLPYDANYASGVHFMVAHGPDKFANYEQLLPADRNIAAEIALSAARLGYIVGSDRDKRHDKPPSTSTCQPWDMFNMHVLKYDLPASTTFSNLKEDPNCNKLREPLSDDLSRMTRNFMRMFQDLTVLEDTHVGDYQIYNGGAFAKLPSHISAPRFAELLLSLDNQISHIWHKSVQARGSIYIHQNALQCEFKGYASRLSRRTKSTSGLHRSLAPDYSWTLVEDDKDLMFALSPHIRSGGGFLQTLGIVPVRTPTPGYSHKPALERAREAVNGFASQWGLIQRPKQPRGTFSC